MKWQDLFFSSFSVSDVQIPLRILEQGVTFSDTLDESGLNVVFFAGGVARIFLLAIRTLTTGFLALKVFGLAVSVLGDFVVRVRGPFVLVVVIGVIRVTELQGEG